MELNSHAVRRDSCVPFSLSNFRNIFSTCNFILEFIRLLRPIWSVSGEFWLGWPRTCVWGPCALLASQCGTLLWGVEWCRRGELGPVFNMFEDPCNHNFFQNKQFLVFYIKYRFLFYQKKTLLLSSYFRISTLLLSYNIHNHHHHRMR